MLVDIFFNIKVWGLKPPTLVQFKHWRLQLCPPNKLKSTLIRLHYSIILILFQETDAQANDLIINEKDFPKDPPILQWKASTDSLHPKIFWPSYFKNPYFAVSINFGLFCHAPNTILIKPLHEKARHNPNFQFSINSNFASLLWDTEKALSMWWPPLLL